MTLAFRFLSRCRRARLMCGMYLPICCHHGQSMHEQQDKNTRVFKNTIDKIARARKSCLFLCAYLPDFQIYVHMYIPMLDKTSGVVQQYVCTSPISEESILQYCLRSVPCSIRSSYFVVVCMYVMYIHTQQYSSGSSVQQW